jgi:hypothetical protein
VYGVDDAAFKSWTASQTITVLGKAGRQAALNALWSDDWDKDSKANVVYNDG